MFSSLLPNFNLGSDYGFDKLAEKLGLDVKLIQRLRLEKSVKECIEYDIYVGIYENIHEVYSNKSKSRWFD